jgi:predicted helicase
MTIQEYITDINKEYKTGRATEHSYRGYLQTLIKTMVTDVMVTNEPTRVKCGAPDYIITKKDIPVGYIEAKDVGYKLDDKQYKEQFDRYRKSLNNLIITDYIDFWLFIDGELIKKIKIAEVVGNEIKSLPEHHNEFTNLIKDFCTHIGQTIKSSKKLAEMMAGKARMLAEVIEKALIEDEANLNNPDTALQSQLHAFKEILIHDIKPKEFGDIYAQTIAYGMFAARLHDPTLPTFSRQEAAELIPKTNPFLRKLFQYIAGYDLDQRLVWIVDGLADIFRATDVAAILKNFGNSTKTNDPIIHFYETFLSEYDPALRKARGVWYTPEPVVNFIVRAVDDILKTEFGLKDGLADTSKTKIKTKVYTKATSDKRSIVKENYIEQEVHKVQILDAATGTGTFLAEVVKHVYKKFEGQQGIWSKYVDEHLVPRLNGFEILMASYSMAHLKLDMLLTETGYKQSKEQRFKIYLTNSLEEHHQDTGTLFANWLSAEANEANQIKRDTPVMCVIGNPPYSGVSSNNGEWISKLIEDYKYIDGIHFNERKHWLNDDYVKFIRFGQHFIEKNGSGVLAYINPHGFLDNPTFRGMRWHLLKTFDKIYTIDLHGNSKKKETSPDGSADQNVFDIMQGVAVTLFIKTGQKKTDELAKVFHHDLYGKRDLKYDFLTANNLKTIPFKELTPEKPFLFFVPKNDTSMKQYELGLKVDSLFNLNKIGICTQRDGIAIQMDKANLTTILKDIQDLEPESFRKKYKERPDGRDWKISTAKANVKDTKCSDEYIRMINYRVFDKRWTYYTNKSKGFMSYPRYDTLKHLIKGNNYAIVLPRQLATQDYKHIFITDEIFDQCFISNLTKEGNYAFPLYLYPDTDGQQTIDQTTERTPNLNLEIVQQIADSLNLKFTNEKQQVKGTFAPIDILDYIYAVLHSPTYREKYKEFLKIDFPRVPTPSDHEKFWKLVKLGSELRQVHLLESDTVSKYITKYPVDGDNIVTKIKYDSNKVYINDTQYFDGVPSPVWDFYIGGYQPAQKWLKDRKERELNFDDILHYQKIIVALSETIRLMAEVDKVGVE